MFTSTSLAAGAALISIAAGSPVQRQASKFTYYDLKTALASPCDITTGQDGKIYVSEVT